MTRFAHGGGDTASACLLRAVVDFRGNSARRASALHHLSCSRLKPGNSSKEGNVAKAKNAVPEGHHAVTPVLAMDNAAKTLEWYKKAFGAVEVSRAVGPDGKILHAEVRIGDSPIMLNDAMGAKGPKSLGGSPASLWVYVEDCDSLYNRAKTAGAKEAEG